MAAAHHRLNYIHPFIDGNGRVSRLMSHAMALQAGIGAHGLWSISRGLARGLQDAGEYKRMMDMADSPRRGDLGGAHHGRPERSAREDLRLLTGAKLLVSTTPKGPVRLRFSSQSGDALFPRLLPAQV